MKQRLVGGWFLAGALAGSMAASCAMAQEIKAGTPSFTASTAPEARDGTSAPVAGAQPGSAGQNTEPARAPRRRPTAVDEILNMAQAGVAPEVIKTFVEQAPLTGFPSATEIIALNRAGVPNDIAVALMKRAGELKVQLPPPGPAAAAAMAAPVNRNSVNAARYNLPDPESYDFWWYHYAYPRTLASANARLYGPYTSYPSFQSYPAFGFGFYPQMGFRPHPRGGPFR
jgi:hypothetical protein